MTSLFFSVFLTVSSSISSLFLHFIAKFALYLSFQFLNPNPLENFDVIYGRPLYTIYIRH